jgi:hypothetical protein
MARSFHAERDARSVPETNVTGEQPSWCVSRGDWNVRESTALEFVTVIVPMELPSIETLAGWKL